MACPLTRAASSEDDDLLNGARALSVATEDRMTLLGMAAQRQSVTIQDVLHGGTSHPLGYVLIVEVQCEVCDVVR
jgi:hypothetical protein